MRHHISTEHVLVTKMWMRDDSGVSCPLFLKNSKLPDLIWPALSETKLARYEDGKIKVLPVCVGCTAFRGLRSSQRTWAASIEPATGATPEAGTTSSAGHTCLACRHEKAGNLPTWWLSGSCL